MIAWVCDHDLVIIHAPNGPFISSADDPRDTRVCAQFLTLYPQTATPAVFVVGGGRMTASASLDPCGTRSALFLTDRDLKPTTSDAGFPPPPESQSRELSIQPEMCVHSKLSFSLFTEGV